MRNKRLQSQVTAGRWTLPAVIFICALCWVLTYFLFPDSIASTTPKDSSSFLQSTRDLLLPGWAERIVSFLVYAIIGYFLIELNNQFSIIRMRASMQTAIYFLLVTVCPGMHLLYIGDIVALGSLISIYFLFKSYQQAQAAGYLFYSSRFFVCSKPTVSSRSLLAVSAVRCSDGCYPTGCCSDTPSSITRWSCSTALSTSY